MNDVIRKPVSPSELDLETPGRRDYFVALEHDSLWADHLIPLTVLVGPNIQPGRGLIAFGGTHGNEYEGPVAVRQILSEINLDNVTGRLILIPVLNVAAFSTGTRDSVEHDGVNLNRAFVDGAGTRPELAGITHRIAAFVRQCIWPNVHVVLDLHSGGRVAQFVPCASFHPIDDPQLSRQTEDVARWFGTPHIMVYQNQTPGLLTSEAERLGKTTVGAELGHGESVNRMGVTYGKHGILAAAIHHDQLQGSILPIGAHADGSQRKIGIVDRDCYHYAPTVGVFEPLVDLGDLVNRSDALGRIHEFQRIDEPPQLVTSAIDGTVVALAWHARVIQGQHVAVIGRLLES